MMTAFAQRRTRNILATAVVAGLIVVAELQAPPLMNLNFVTGWVLTAGLVFLALFNARKKIPMIPVLSAAAWLQLHIYVGLLAAFLFAVHSQFRYPGGAFNQALWWFFVVLTLSGIVGIFMERAIAPRLRERGEAILFDRLNGYRLQLADETAALAAQSVTEVASPLLVDLYRDRIAPYMAGPRNFWTHLVDSRKPLDHLVGEMRALERYLNPRGRETLRAIEERVVAKDNLDHQYALLTLLRGWLFLHIPLAYGIFLLIAVHIVLVYAFGRF
jgi:hypothetical protein